MKNTTCKRELTKEEMMGVNGGIDTVPLPERPSWTAVRLVNTSVSWQPVLTNWFLLQSPISVIPISLP